MRRNDIEAVVRAAFPDARIAGKELDSLAFAATPFRLVYVGNTVMSLFAQDSGPPDANSREVLAARLKDTARASVIGRDCAWHRIVLGDVHLLLRHVRLDGDCAPQRVGHVFWIVSDASINAIIDWAAATAFFDLSPRETEVLKTMFEGVGRSWAAQQLGVSVETVKSHLISVYRKLNVGGLVAAMNRLVSFVSDVGGG